MRILVFTAIYPPEIRSQSHLFHEMVLEMRRRNHDVKVITKVPSHYVAEGSSDPISAGWGEVDGVPTYRVGGFPLKGRQPLIRALEHLTLGQSFASAARKIPNVDVVLVYSPPLPLAGSAMKYTKAFGAPFVLNVQDIYPQTAIDLGLLRNKLAIKLAERMEGRAYNNASRIVVHSPGNREYLVNRRGAPAEKVKVIYNWVDTDVLRPYPTNGAFRGRHGLEGKFVVSYAGLMGYAQDLTSIIECADLMKDEQNVVFLLVGEGVLESRWKEMVRDRGLRNVTFLPLLPRDEYAKLLVASDVCLVPLAAELRTPVVPGKLQSIMATGRPAIAIVDANGDTPRILKESGGGFAVEPGQSVRLREAVKQLQSSPALREDMGRRGRTFAETNFSLKVAVDAYERLFEEIIEVKGGRFGKLS